MVRRRYLRIMHRARPDASDDDRSPDQASGPRRLAEAVDAVELVVGHVLAQHVAPVVGEPQLVRARLPVEADGIADAVGDIFQAAAVGVHAGELGVGLALVAQVAGRADRHVELAVRAERDELAAVPCRGGQAVVHRLRLRRIVQVMLDVMQHQDAADRRDVQVAVPEGDADRHLQAAGDDAHLVDAAVVVAVGERVDLAGVHRSDEHRPGAAQRHFARRRHLIGVERDVEPLRQA